LVFENSMHNFATRWYNRWVVVLHLLTMPIFFFSPKQKKLSIGGMPNNFLRLSLNSSYALMNLLKYAVSLFVLLLGECNVLYSFSWAEPIGFLFAIFLFVSQ
jgi:hypothetical protein